MSNYKSDVVEYWSTSTESTGRILYVHITGSFVCCVYVYDTFITFCHRSSISILVSMCVQGRPVESEDIGLPDTVSTLNITVIFATLVACRVAKNLHALFVDLPLNP